jgi:hypothetical protein
MKGIVSYEGKKTHTGRVSKGRQAAQSDGFDDCTGARTEQGQNTFVSININSPQEMILVSVSHGKKNIFV